MLFQKYAKAKSLYFIVAATGLYLFYLSTESSVNQRSEKLTLRADYPKILAPNATKAATVLPDAELSVTMSSLGERPLDLMSTNARNSQLSHLGFATPMTAAQWYAYAQSIMASSPNIASDIQASPITAFTNPVFGAFASVMTFGIVMIFLSPIILLSFCCLRNCCNTCGGKRPNPAGYNNRDLFGMFGSLAIVGILNLTFAAILMAYGSDFTGTVGVFEKAAHAGLKDGIGFAANAMSGLANMPLGVTGVARNAVGNLTDPTGSFMQTLNGTITLPFFAVVDDLDTFSETMLSAERAANKSSGAYNSVLASAAQLKADMNKHASEYDAQKTVFFNGTYWPINNFPSADALRNAQVPSASTAPDFSKLSSALISGSDSMKAFGKMSRQTWGIYITNLSTTMNSALNPFIGMLSADSLAGLSANLTADGTRLDGELTAAFKDVNTYVGYFASLLNVEAALFILAPLLLVVVGVLLRRKGLMNFHPCTIIFLLSIFWLQFVIFYLLSTPLNVVCNSMDKILDYDYTTADINSIASVDALSSMNLTVGFNPQVFLKSCQSGNTLFGAAANSKGDNMMTFVVELANANFGVVDNILDSVINVTKIVEAFDPSSALDAVDLTAMGKTNFSSIAFTQSNVIPTVNTYIAGVNAVVSVLTPASFDSDRGSTTVMNTKLNEFNAYALSLNGAWTDYTTAFITTNYVTPKVYDYDPTLVTNDVNSVNNAEVKIRFNSVLFRMVFIDQANTAIAGIQSNVTSLNSRLNTTAITGTAKINTETATALSSFVATGAAIDQIPIVYARIRSKVTTLMTRLRTFAVFMQYSLHVFLRDLVFRLLDVIIVNNPDPNFLHCQQVGNDVLYALDGFCGYFVNDLSGFWSDSLLLAIFLFFGFFLTLMAKKRVKFLKSRTEEKDMKDEKPAAKAKKSNAKIPKDDGILATAPFQ